MNQSSVNINTPEYWNEVYRREWEENRVGSADYNRDYGPIHDAIVGLIREGCRVLDIACGTGVLCRKVKQRVPAAHVMGIDFSEYTIARNQQMDRALGIEYRCMDVQSLSSLQEEFDAITMCEIIEHLDEPAVVIDDAIKLLRPGGLFFLSCPHDDEISDPEHIRQWGHDELFHLLMPYSDTISFRHFPPPYFHVWMVAYFTKAPCRQTRSPF